MMYADPTAQKVFDRTLPIDPNAPPAAWNPNQPGRIHHMAGRIGMPSAPPMMPGPFDPNEPVYRAQAFNGQWGPWAEMPRLGAFGAQPGPFAAAGQQQRPAMGGGMATLSSFGRPMVPSRGLPSGRMSGMPSTPRSQSYGGLR